MTCEEGSHLFPIFTIAMRFFALALLLCGVVASNAQTPEVPHKIDFAGMTLVVRDDARAEIQKDVDALTRSPKYFNIKAERARTYFPTIERIFREERVPLDFKFLVLQESALIADAVSETNAVGFWQFKDFTASEMGLRVDKLVDERMNITASTRAAARYIKQNNYSFNNWVYALQAYQMGAGGVKRMVGDDLDGSRKMEITADTYWYVKKFLAHKVAFEEAVSGPAQVKITEHDITTGGSLAGVASQLSVDGEKLKEFNKWVRNNEIPSDKPYTLIIPNGETVVDFSKLHTVPVVAATPVRPDPIPEQDEVLINDIPVVQARNGETLESLAKRCELDVAHFLRYNELSEDHQVVPGGYYFTAKKKTKAGQEYHKLKPGEDLWTVSQTYGVQVKRLRKLNHLDDSDKPSEGTMIWLNTERPETSEVADGQESVLEVGDEFIDWSAVRPGGSQPDAGSEPVHLVAEGETLYAISKKYGISVDELVSANKLASTELQPGQTLRVAPRSPVTGIVHEVQVSETLYSVARRYGISVEELMESNNKTDFSVALGEKLKIPAR
jgi:membrane-bound lytic murein transglycosylase D